MTTTTKWVPLDDMRTDGGTQVRTTLDQEAIDDYAEAMADGTEFPPVDVFWDGNGHYWLAHGFHRYQAATKVELEKIECHIHKGELRDAIWFALSANATNGLRRTREDKQKAVEKALSDPEWAQKTDRVLATHIGVSHTFVKDVRDALLESAPTETTRIGKDGKKYKAQKPQRKPASPESAPEADSPAEAEPHDDQPTEDQVGQPLPDDLREVFGAAEEFRAKRRELSAIRQWVEEQLALPVGRLFAKSATTLKADFGNLDRAFKFSTPHAVCPYCKAKEQKRRGCAACEGSGWVSKEVYDQSPAARERKAG